MTDWLSKWLSDWLIDCLTDWLTVWLTNWLTYWLTAVNSRATHVFQRFTRCLCHFLTAPAGAGFTNRLSLLFLSATLAVLHSLSLSAPPPLLSFLLVHSSVCSFPCYFLPLFFSLSSSELGSLHPSLHPLSSCIRYSNASSCLLLWLLCHAASQWLGQ